jgi:chromosome segregation ATPase
MPASAGPGLWPWGVILAAGTSAGSWVTAWLTFRRDKDSSAVAHEAVHVQQESVAVAGLRDLVAEYREQVQYLRSEVLELKGEHTECQRQLADANKDLSDLRGDLTVLQGLVVTQIDQEAAKPDRPHRRTDDD